MINTRKTLGNFGEDLTAAWLEQRSYTILARNYTTRWGEIDLIAQKDDVIAFIEVKTRKNVYFNVATVVTRSKQLKMIRTAQQYILTHKIYEKVFRFDVATVTPNENHTYHVEYIENAFTQ